MAGGYLPTREAEFVTWVNGFDQNLSTKPAGYFGVAADAIEQYHTTLTRFTDAYALASNPDTRTGPVLEAKDMAKRRSSTPRVRSSK